MIDAGVLLAYEPREEWFLHKSRLHGIAHTARVLILQELLSNILSKKGMEFDREAVRWAAALHDTQRHDDGLDPKHGLRAGDWIMAADSVNIPQGTREGAAYAARWHVTDDEEIPDLNAELKILKDADGLDRVRLSDLDPNYLRYEETKGLITIAERLYAESNTRGNILTEPFVAVMDTARGIGIVLER